MPCVFLRHLGRRREREQAVGASQNLDANNYRSTERERAGRQRLSVGVEILFGCRSTPRALVSVSDLWR
jgi:hypothetical protein